MGTTTRDRFSRMRRLLPAAALLLALGGLARAGGAAAAPEKVAGGIRFTYEDNAASAVSWAGEYNGWSATANPMTKSDGVWSITLPLGPGEQQYKFVVDGTWVADPDNPLVGGDYGNSVVRITPSGDLQAAPASAGGLVTPYSPKITMGGRAIGLYQSTYVRDDDRFELRRPTLDFDVDFGIRISELLRSRFLMKINSEADDVDLFRTRLNFDRGNLTFEKKDFEIFAYDNEDAGTWDDPMRLVGNVGIYGYPYGYDRQGFRFRGQPLGCATELHYADNFQAGGTIYPTISGFSESDAIGDLGTRPDGAGGWELVPRQFTGRVTTNLSDGNEDMLAFRTRREVRPGLTLGALGRTDRGFNLGRVIVAFPTGPDELETWSGRTYQLWYAYGGEARWASPYRAEFWAEALRGGLQANLVDGTRMTWAVTGADANGVTGTQLLSVADANDRSVRLDDSRRVQVGGRWVPAHGDITFEASFEYQDRQLQSTPRGTERSDLYAGRDRMRTVHLRWDRNRRYYLNREVTTGLDVELTTFDYGSLAGSNWRRQFWFPDANFWLEQNGDLVRYDRLVMLGGYDVWSIRPELEVPIDVAHSFTARYVGRINTIRLDTRPKYLESVFQVGRDLSPALRASLDTRWVKYDDPLLGLYGGYVAHFVELRYRYAPGIEVSLSYGVDPWVLDPRTNEYEYIGRDRYLFDRGANEGNAQNDYLGLRDQIAAAEKSMRDARVIQVEAVVRF